MKIVDIADELYRELGEPSSISIPAISFWIRSNVGELNNRINTTFKIVDYGSDAYEFSGSFIAPENEPQVYNEGTGALGLSISGNQGESSTPAIVSIQAEEAAVLKKMYIVHYYDQQIRSTVGAASTDPVVEVASVASSTIILPSAVNTPADVIVTPVDPAPPPISKSPLSSTR